MWLGGRQRVTTRKEGKQCGQQKVVGWGSGAHLILGTVALPALEARGAVRVSVTVALAHGAGAGRRAAVFVAGAAYVRSHPCSTARALALLVPAVQLVVPACARACARVCVSVCIHITPNWKNGVSGVGPTAAFPRPTHASLSRLARDKADAGHRRREGAGGAGTDPRAKTKAAR